MARKSKGISVYERINNQLEEIKNQEIHLENLREKLQELYSEKDDLEMRQLLEQMKSNNLNIDKALELLSKNSK